MGGHRFFTKVEEVKKILARSGSGTTLLRRPRLSRIYYDAAFSNYPLRPLNALLEARPVCGAAIVLSYLRWQLFPIRARIPSSSG